MEKMDSVPVCQHVKVFALVGMANSAGSYRNWICKMCGEEGSEQSTSFDWRGDEYGNLMHKKATGGFNG